MTEQDEGDLTHFSIYHLGTIERSIRDLHAYLGRKAEDLREIQADDLGHARAVQPS